MSKDLDEKFVSDDGISSVEDPVVGAGGKIEKRRGDVKKEVSSPEKLKAEKFQESEEVDNDISSIFEGMDLSEEFKERASLVFESALNEAILNRVESITEELEQTLREEFETSLTESLEEIIENLDKYMDYVVKEWMEENELAMESSVKVQMAESFMENLQSLFVEHNIELDESNIDVVATLEEETDTLKSELNEAINANISMAEEISRLRAEKVFSEVCEDLTDSQVDRLAKLSENLDYEDLNSFRKNLDILKESFFSKQRTVATRQLDEELEVLNEDNSPKITSKYDTVNAMAAALKNSKFK